MIPCAVVIVGALSLHDLFNIDILRVAHFEKTHSHMNWAWRDAGEVKICV